MNWWKRRQIKKEIVEAALAWAALHNTYPIKTFGGPSYWKLQELAKKHEEVG